MSAADREAAYKDPSAIVAYDANGNPWPGYYVPLEQKVELERQIAELREKYRMHHEEAERLINENRELRWWLDSLGRIVCRDSDGRRYAGSFADEAAARAWLDLQPNRDSLRLVRVVEIPLDPAEPLRNTPEKP